jgi:hypothetical protein
MSRPVSIHVSYRDDGGFLLRLEAAVLKDDSQSEGWRNETARMTRQLALRLLAANKQPGKVAVVPVAKRSAR